MKVGKKGVMNIGFSETYDLEVDDVILLEVGLFAHLPTGFRILNFHKHKVKSVPIADLTKKVKGPWSISRNLF